MGLLDLFNSILRKETGTNLEEVRQPITRVRNITPLRPSAIEFRRPPIPYATLRVLAYNSDIERTIINALKGEIFRNGIEIKPNFITRCLQCDKEFDNKIDICPNCSTPVVEPDQNEFNLLKEKSDKINTNNQSLQELLENIEEDLEIFDNAYILFNYQTYTYNLQTGEIVSGDLKELTRASPEIMHPFTDKYGRFGYDSNNKPTYVCPQHRTEKLSKPKCLICKKSAYPIHYVARQYGEDTYYMENEVLHERKYAQSLTEGYSPIFSLWKKIFVLLKMDDYLYRSYNQGKPPKKFFIVNTMDPEDLEKTWEEMLDKLQENPNGVYPLAVNNSNTQGKIAEVIDLMGTMEEQKLLELRNEMRRAIGAFYGVTPLFSGDLQTAGGLNNEGQQILITNKAVERGQNIFNHRILKKIIEKLGVKDYTYTLQPNEESDEMKDLKINEQKILNAQRMQQMGFTISTDDEGDFIFSKKPENPPLNSVSSTPQSKTLTETKQTDTEELFKENLKKKTIEKLSRGLDKELLEVINSIFKNLDIKNPNDLKKAINKISLELKSKSNRKLNKLVKKVYKKTLDDVEKEIGKNIIFTNFDKFVVESIKSNPFLIKALDDMGTRTTNKVRKAFTENFDFDKGINIKKLKEDLGDILDTEESNIDTIARTETTKIANSARINAYKQHDPEGKDKYIWHGPNDFRTTNRCKKIMSLSKQGLPMEDLIDVIIQEAVKFDPNFTVDRNHPVAGYNCRHVIIKKVG